MIELIFDGKQIFSRDSESVEKLEKNYFGSSRKGLVFLEPEEALYIMMFQNGRCRDKSGKDISFNHLASCFAGKEIFYRTKTFSKTTWTASPFTKRVTWFSWSI